MFSLGTLGAFRLSLLTVKRMFQIYIKIYAENILAEKKPAVPTESAT